MNASREPRKVACPVGEMTTACLDNRDRNRVSEIWLGEVPAVSSAAIWPTQVPPPAPLAGDRLETFFFSSHFCRDQMVFKVRTSIAVLVCWTRALKLRSRSVEDTAGKPPTKLVAGGMVPWSQPPALSSFGGGRRSCHGRSLSE